MKSKGSREKVKILGYRIQSALEVELMDWGRGVKGRSQQMHASLNQEAPFISSRGGPSASRPRPIGGVGLRPLRIALAFTSWLSGFCSGSSCLPMTSISRQRARTSPRRYWPSSGGPASSAPPYAGRRQKGVASKGLQFSRTLRFDCWFHFAGPSWAGSLGRVGVGFGDRLYR